MPNTVPGLASDEELRVLQKIEKLLDETDYDPIVPFTPEEQKIIRQMVQIYQTLLTFGRVGILAKNLIIGAAAFLAAWLVVYSWAVGNFRSILGLE